jgi:4'-phosphopantetheinyl transferase
VRERLTCLSEPYSSPLSERELPEDYIHVWRAALSVGNTTLQQLVEYLSPQELARSDRFLFESDRLHFIVARGILRELLGEYLKQPPHSIRIEAGAYGKPVVHGETGASSLRFNLSHSHGLALYAFARGREVGIDVEKIRPEIALQGIESRYFSAQEGRELQKLPDNLRAEGFFLCWTRKEAYLKARGQGLQVPLDSFDVSLTPNEPPNLNSADRKRWTIRSCYPHPGFVGALVSEGHQNRTKCWEWQGSSIELFATEETSSGTSVF